MILDLTLLFGLLSFFGWVAAIIFGVLFLRRGTHVLRTREELSDARSLVANQAARLETFDDVTAALEAERHKVIALQREEASLLAKIEERERSVTDLKTRLEDEFRSVSTKLLRETGDALLREANQTFAKQQVVAQREAEGYSQSVSELLKPMKETLSRYEDGLRQFRDHTQKAQGELSGQIATLAESASAVQSEARTLSTALTAGPRTRGRWGETTLLNVVEMTGLSSHCDFTEQLSVNDESGSRKQPDLVVNLPGERVVAIDSKVSLNDWLDAAEAESDSDRKAALERHGRAVWTHVQSLAAKDYAGALKKARSIDFVVMFLPGETFFTSAIEARSSLFQDAYDKGVLIATPTTLIAILKSIAYAWQQQRADENARHVADLASDLYESLRNCGGRIADLGKSLDKTVANFNGLVGNVEGRVLPRARRLAEYEMPGTETPLTPLMPSEATIRHPSESRDLLFDESIAGCAE